MKILLLEPKVKAKAPNLALMKWARWCMLNGHEYKYVRGIVDLKGFRPDQIYMSCIFSYFSKRYELEINYYLNKFPNAKITVGGVFPTINPGWFDKWKDDWLARMTGIEDRLTVHQGIHYDIDGLAPYYSVDIEYEDDKPPYPNDKIILYASRGCVNKCAYCAVPKLEPEFISFKSIQYMLDAAKEDGFADRAAGVWLYDNNFTEHEYPELIIDELVKFGKPVDFRQGLHVESFTRKHAKLFKKLSWLGTTPYIRFSFDKWKYADDIEKALSYVIEADNAEPDKSKLPQVFCYLLYNFTDGPQDMWGRIMKAQEIVDRQNRSLFLFPMKYEPYGSLKRNQYVGPKWQKYVETRWPMGVIVDGKRHKVTGMDLVKGVTRMHTWIHGYFAVTTTKNLYNWIGKSCDEMMDRAIQMAVDNKLEKMKGDYINIQLALNECTLKPERIIKSPISLQ